MYLLPQPNHIKYEKNGNDSQDYFFLRYDTDIVLDANTVKDTRRGLLYADLLRREIASGIGLALSVKQKKDNFGKEVVFFTCKREADSDPEGYRLAITQERITIEGGDEAGLLYGVQTLRQIIRQCGYKLPCLVIEDAPKIPHRGLSYDVTRGRVPTLEYLKKLADHLSFYKYNQLQLYVEHSYLFEDFSEVWRDNTPLTAEEILELDAYCADRQIELVPSLASFGHLYEVLITKSYSHLCELEGADREPFSLVSRMGHHTVNVSDEESFRMVTGRIKEFMSLFSSRYFNICADETFDLCKGRSKALGEEKGVRRVYVDFLKRLCEFCLDHNRIPMFWGDVLVEEPELLGELPAEGICLNWEYGPDVKEDQVRKLTEAGVKHLYLCPGVQSWNHFINRYRDAYRNIAGMCANAHKYHAEGLLNTEWGDLGHVVLPDFSAIPQIYGAAFSWSDQMMSEDEINGAISVIHYGDASGELVDMLAELSEQECVNWWHAVQYMEEQTGQLVKKPDEMMESILEEACRTKDPEKLYRKLEKNDALLECIYHKLQDVSGNMRQELAAFLLMGKGQKLLALTGYYMDRKKPGFTDPDPDRIGISPRELAAEWEKWLLRYSELWRKTSKESELHRVKKVICWYADRLRDSGK